ncbi:hypothetical protein AQUCO_01800197v1 [Aquilegia coerulea]|uniref:Uncharacterized protein n=1 Tax=Aquilegia coerulea TaxID=218851 RepID=A0A2G5DL39_AQUCA|nr:hypothetical protein AQUCO_01800197v1 [Aquilegia coerulea]
MTSIEIPVACLYSVSHVVVISRWHFYIYSTFFIVHYLSTLHTIYQCIYLVFVIFSFLLFCNLFTPFLWTTY